MKPAKLNPYLSPGIASPESRREAAEGAREMEVERFADEILHDEQYLNDAIGEAGSYGIPEYDDLNKFLFVLARCETDEHFGRNRTTVQAILKAIAGWYAEKKTPPVPCFFYPQAS